MLNAVTKSDFARLVNLSPGRVSQLISGGKISDCLIGEGRNQRIDADKAIEKLRIRRDPGQALGNGAKVQLSLPAEPPGAEAPRVAALSESDDISLKLQRVKLEEAEFRNRRLREEERLRAGAYVLAEDVKADTARLVLLLQQLFENGLMNLATKLASAFKLPPRDVEHLFRTEIHNVRTKVSTTLAADAASVTATIEAADPVNA